MRPHVSDSIGGTVNLPAWMGVLEILDPLHIQADRSQSFLSHGFEDVALVPAWSVLAWCKDDSMSGVYEIDCVRERRANGLVRERPPSEDLEQHRQADDLGFFDANFIAQDLNCCRNSCRGLCGPPGNQV